ncbi:MAG: serine/threonine-protein kinase [Acidobacteriota bacterium]
MNPEDRRARAYRLFTEALELDEEHRRRSLVEACEGDAELLAEVETLLEADRSDMDLGEVVWGDVTPSVIEGLAGPTSEHAPGLPAGFELGRYTIVRRISSGGMAVVYEAEQDEPRRRVALKLLRELGSEDAARRFRVEAAVLGALDHVGIAKVFEVGLGTMPGGERVRFIAMEHVDGMHLDEHVGSRSLPVDEVIELVARIAEAVGHAHRRGIVHRDLKPSNCLVDREGQPKVIDFGVASIRDAELGATLAQTATGEVLGTLVYMAPEQLAGRPDAIGPPTDVHALGTILYELLSGRRPHDTGAQGTAELLTRGEEAPRLRSLLPELPRDVEVIVHAALEPEPSRRYDDAGALAADLRRYLRHEPIETRPPSALYRLGKWSRRNRTPLKAIAVTLGLLGVAALVLWSARAWSDHRLVVQREAELEARFAIVRERIEALRAAGDEAAASALFDELVDDPAHAGSQAVARAWLDEGERLTGEGRLSEAMPSLGLAYTLAPTPSLRAEALERLLRNHREMGRLIEAGAVLGLLEREHPEHALDDVESLRFETALSRADLAAARKHLPEGDPREPFLELLASAPALGSVEPLPRGSVLASHDIDGDARDELLIQPRRNSLAWLTAEGASTVMNLPPSLRSYDQDEITHEHVVERAAPGDETAAPLLVLRDVRTDENVLLEVGETSLREHLRWPGESIFALGAVGEAAGSARVFAGSAWRDNRFLELDLRERRVEPAHPETEAWGSYITAMASMDLNDDGRDELVVGLGAPEGFGIRVYDTSGPLRLLARRGLCYVHDIKPFVTAEGRTLIAVVQARWHRSKLVFPEGDHGGPPLAIHLLGLEDDRLVVEHVIRQRAELIEIHNVGIGDIDGDGLADIVLAEPPRSRLLRQVPGTGDLTFADLTLGGWEVQATVQLDEDAPLEVVLRSSSLDGSPSILRVLGLPGEPLPPLPALESVVYSAELAPAWQRALQLRDVGLGRVAGESLVQLATFEVSPEQRARALTEAADLMMTDEERHGLVARVGDLRVAAAAANRAEPALWRRALETLVEQGRSRDVLSLARERLDDPTVPEADRRWARERIAERAELEDPAFRQTLGFAGPLDPAWQVEQPLLIYHDPRGASLDIDGFNRTGVLARLPLRRVGTDLGMSLAADISWLERGADLLVGLRPRGADDLVHGVKLSGYGWGGFLFRVTVALEGGKDHLLSGRRDVTERPAVESIEVEVLSRLGEGTWYSFDGPTGEKRTFIPMTHGGEEEAWELVIIGTGPVQIESAWGQVRLRELRLQGLRVDAESAALGDGRGLRLQQLLDGSRHHPDELRELLADPVLRRVAAGALRLVPTEVTRPLQDALGPAGFLSLLHDAWADAIDTYLAEPHVVTGLLTTPHLVSERADEDDHALALLVARGRARWLQGDAVGARRDLLRSSELVRRGPGEERCFVVETTLAEIAATLEEVDEARVRMEEALRCAPAEDLGRDRLLRRSVLRPLLDGTKTDS